MSEPPVTLKEYLTALFEAKLAWIDRHFTEQIRAINEATAKALAALNERLAGMNEFRKTLEDLSATFVTRSDLEVISHRIHELELAKQKALTFSDLDVINNKLMELEKAKAKAEGRAAVLAGVVATVVSMAVSVGASFIVWKVTQ